MVVAAGGYLAAKEIAGDGSAGAEDGAAGPQPAGQAPLFTRDPGHVNLTTFVLASHPRPVREAIERHRRALDRNTALTLRESEVALEEAARRAVADYLEAEPEDVALTDSTTMGLGLVYARLRLDPGGEVVTLGRFNKATRATRRRQNAQ